MRIKHLVLLAGGLLLSVVFTPVFAGTIEAINHTKWAINKFSVDGQSGMDAIGPFQGGGGGCCYSAPAVWKPGMRVKVDWETGIGSEKDVSEIPRPKMPVNHGQNKTEWDREVYAYNEALAAWFQQIKTLNKEHTRIIALPPYSSSEKNCGITVHFLPCDDIKVTTSCADYGSPDYPIKDPVHMKEPAECPK